MGVSEFLLGTGIATIIALLGWGNQIKEPQTDTTRLEKLFSKRLETKYAAVKSAVRKADLGDIEQNFGAMLKTIQTIIKKDVGKSAENLRKLNKLADLEHQFEKLKSGYNKKYELAILMAMFSIGMGVIGLTVQLLYGENTGDIVAGILGLISLWYISRILFQLIELHKIEKRFQVMISDADTELED